MQSKFRQTCVSVLLFGCLFACATSPSAITLHIFFTGNLNGALDDCRCGGPLVGGMTRILTVLDSLRAAHPNHLLLDAGDFFTSYSLPEANRVMLDLVAMANYTALNPGDQEFVEGERFLVEAAAASGGLPPLLSSNIRPTRSTPLPFQPMIEKPFGSGKMVLFGVTDPAAFEFITPPSLPIVPPAAALDSLAHFGQDGEGLQILLYHGAAEEVDRLLSVHSWIDVVVMAHSQQRGFLRRGNTAVVQCGADGEYVGHLVIRKEGDKVEFHNEFIPILENLAVHSRAMERVNRYFQSLRQ